MNESKIRDPRMWEKWRKSGALAYGSVPLNSNSLNIAWIEKHWGRLSEFERKIVTAFDINGIFQRYRGKAHLKGFMNGEVIDADHKKRFEISNFDTRNDDLGERLMKERGFTDTDLKKGVTGIIESEFRNPNWPNAKYVQEPKLRHYFISVKTGKVIEGDYLTVEGSFHQSELDPIHYGARRAIKTLSMIPKLILETYGSYDEFKRILGLGKDFDPRGIDYTEFTPTQILYHGGLREFVRALELKEKEHNLKKLDTSSHTLKDSLDNRDHFTKLFEILNPKLPIAEK